MDAALTSGDRRVVLRYWYQPWLSVKLNSLGGEDTLLSKEEKMNVVLNLKEPQLGGVLEVLGKAGDDLDITINIEEEEA
jgi:hypothetical protein